MSASTTPSQPPESSSSRWNPGSGGAVGEFLRTEAGGSALLLAATVIALVWANTPLADLYEDLWGSVLTVDLGSLRIEEDLRHWVNDGLMAFFFYVVGLEVRREFSMGEFTDARQAAVPALAALGGMVVPAALYLAFNAGGEGARGWGIVMATDIAFVLGALALVGPRVPGRIRVFLLTLAIVDDIGAIAVIAVVYSESIDLVALAAAGGIVVAIVALKRVTPWRGPAYFVAGVALWLAVLEAGIHPTIAGVLLGLLTAVHAPRRSDLDRAATLTRSFRQDPSGELGRSALLGVGRALSANERIQHAVHPWTSYVIVPLFALANAGVSLDGDALSSAISSPVTLGILAGLVVGKTAGISVTTLVAVRSGAGRLPRGVSSGQLVGAAALAGIGFTVSLFIVDLAFTDPELREQAKVGVLAASILAAVLGWALFRLAERLGGAAELGVPTRLDPPVDPAHDRIRGSVGASLTLVEYGDYECPFCAQVTGVVEELNGRFGDRFRYVFRHLPLDVHPHAQLAAEAAEAAAAQGHFWEMHDRLFAEPDRLELDDLLGHAQAIGLDVERFAENLRDGVHVPAISADLESAESSGVTGTPTFFIGGVRHAGPHDAETLAAALEAAAAG